MAKHDFTVRPISSCIGHSLIEWGEARSMRGLQVETEIAKLWAAAPALLAACKAVEQVLGTRGENTWFPPSVRCEVKAAIAKAEEAQP